MDKLTQLWQRHIQQHDQEAREALILRFAPLVKYVVGRLALRLPRSLEKDDLLSYGTVGLIEAIDRFDLSYGVKFETYAIARIRGQIIDSLRALDMLPRSAYRRAKKIEAVFAELSQSLGRLPTDPEVANYLGIELSEYHTWLKDATFVIVSLDQPRVFSDGEQATLYDALEDERVLTPAELIDRQELTTQLVSAIRELPEREQLLISLYYNDGLTMKEVGHVLGVSESRVSQMHARTMLLLKGIINHKIEPKLDAYNRRGAYVSAFAASP